MTKTNSKLSRILSTKSAKILASLLILVVLISSFAISSFADTSPVVHEGLYFASGNPVIPSATIVQNIEFESYGGVYDQMYISVGTSGTPRAFYLYYAQLADNNYEQAGANEFSDDGTPYWDNNNYRLIYVSSDSSVSAEYYTWFTSVFVSGAGYNAGFEDGFLAGKDVGFNEGYSAGTSSQAIQNARDEGYNQGVADGRAMTDSENLGANILGDTLNAPMNALNNFVIYESTTGFQVTLGLVVGGAISLTLFIAFLKIFAGG